MVLTEFFLKNTLQQKQSLTWLALRLALREGPYERFAKTDKFSDIARLLREITYPPKEVVKKEVSMDIDGVKGPGDSKPEGASTGTDFTRMLNHISVYSGGDDQIVDGVPPPEPTPQPAADGDVPMTVD